MAYIYMCLPSTWRSCSAAYDCFSRTQTPRARVMLLGSTGPMVSFFAFVVGSVSLTLSKAIRDSERSTPKAAPSPSSHEESSPAARRAVMADGIIIRLWERLTCGGIGGVRGGGAAGIVPKTDGAYAKTKSMLKKLTVASFAVIAVVMATVVGSFRKGTIANVRITSRFQGGAGYAMQYRNLPHVLNVWQKTAASSYYPSIHA